MRVETDIIAMYSSESDVGGTATLVIIHETGIQNYFLK